MHRVRGAEERRGLVRRGRTRRQKGVNPANKLGPELTWGGQSNYILKKGENEYIAMFDIWKANNQVDSRLVWLPVDFNTDNTISIEWK